ncbi:DUF378 domain-containing protein [Candidatus Micrarchaeota archaeon CG_4_10_14_0_2_um_filter_55_9]|nr:MAG: DUF378 domain-containing protein [Candidatus Micrarchaeota archaeon CG09_land_8_20_14_0_10_55_25]PIZ91958.1 MAG: DUF378 domain-containing protein [Candidatus Micrarchaeota archaeon CG_4_10_14_0_2_um_filter_55_9]PJD00823.1 MAG: DUF378 domain-containing protein [Candidatus Micrarchaeota archaeon CG10_big_fil_rev_8_21_14_0_10_54_18]
MKKSALDWIAEILVIIGGLNWGLVGLANMNLVETLVGGIPPLNTAVYALVGLSALYMLYNLFANK